VLSEAADVDIYDVGKPVVLLVPDVLQQFRPADDGLRAVHQVPQNGELAVGERDRTRAARDDM